MRQRGRIAGRHHRLVGAFQETQLLVVGAMAETVSNAVWTADFAKVASPRLPIRRTEGLVWSG